jgi:hypothetical protein
LACLHTCSTDIITQRVHCSTVEANLNVAPAQRSSWRHVARSIEFESCQFKENIRTLLCIIYL